MQARIKRRHDLVVAYSSAVILASCSHSGPASRELERADALAEVPEAKALRAPPLTECPEGMLLIDGEYCPEVEQKCLRWLDPPGTQYATFRCAEYANPSICKAPRVHKRFCIDRTERTDEDGITPRNFVSFHSAHALCKAVGARVCRESEWQFACEGPEMRPYPYGFSRDTTACNTDIAQHLKERGRLKDHRAKAGTHARCASPFGVQDLAGNMEEWVAADGTKLGWSELLKGSWWIPSRHACRQFQIGHGPQYSGAETGTRCCKDAAKGTPGQDPN